MIMASLRVMADGQLPGIRDLPDAGRRCLVYTTRSVLLSGAAAGWRPCSIGAVCQDSPEGPKGRQTQTRHGNPIGLGLGTDAGRCGLRSVAARCGAQRWAALVQRRGYRPGAALRLPCGRSNSYLCHTGRKRALCRCAAPMRGLAALDPVAHAGVLMFSLRRFHFFTQKQLDI